MNRFLVFSLFLLLTAGGAGSHAQRRTPSGGARNANSIHWAGDKLLETELYEAYAHANRTFCYLNRDGSGEVSLALVFKVDANYVIDYDDDAYRQRFEKELLPLVKRGCPSVDRIDVYHYVKGVRIAAQDLEEYGYDEEMPGDEKPLGHFIVSIDKQRGIGYSQFGDYERSLADLRRKRATKNGTPAPTPDASKASSEKSDEDRVEYTRDGKLKLAGIEHNKLFRQIYDGEFIRMSREDPSDSYLPYLMFSGHISVYGDLCRSQLSPSAVGVDIYGERYLRTEYSAFTRTEYYERYLAKTVYMEPKYEAAYRLSVLTSLTKIYESWKRRPGDIGVPAYLILSTSRALPLLLDSRQLISDNGCASPSTARFTENLHKYVTGNWNTMTADGYAYDEKEYPTVIERAYVKVPPTFSPQFPDLSKKKNFRLVLNPGDERPGLKWVSIDRFGDMNAEHLEDLATAFFPAHVRSAVKEQKYYVASCTYHVFDGRQTFQDTVHYWVANAPLPPAPVQEYVKGVIRPPVDRCPVTYPGQ
jgi:hypothetical protein